MKVELLQPDPELEFGNENRGPDMRFGIGHFGAFDFSDQGGPRNIKVGFVGTDETITALTEWLTKCKSEIPAKPSKQPNLHPPFPGFDVNHSFHSSLVWNPGEFRAVTIPDAAKRGSFNEIVEKVAELYIEEIEKVIEKTGADIVMCAPPLDHLALVTRVANEEKTEEDFESSEEKEVPTWYEFHDLLKAKSLHLRTPLQYILPATYDESKSAAQKKIKNRNGQDEATRAWNLFTAMYYKAHGIPWRMTRDDAEVRTCYLGISFFRTLDKQKIYASSAQVFNERGEGVIVRGGIAYRDKDDRNIHLDSNGAYNLIKLALDAFKGEHGHYPARVVIHKTSEFSDDEFEGCSAFLKEKEIDKFDAVYLSESFTRLFRSNSYPPLRGTLWHLDDRRAILYTRGSVPFYETYPGIYPPKSVYLDCTRAQRSVRELARECLALTKMNWNNTRFDGQLPITLRAAKQVGYILKYIDDEDARQYSSSYRFYM
jgi:hypothetical protein